MENNKRVIDQLIIKSCFVFLASVEQYLSEIKRGNRSMELKVNNILFDGNRHSRETT